MPTMQEYSRMRRIASAQQELAGLQKEQGEFLERVSTELLEKGPKVGTPTEEKPKPVGMPKVRKLSIINVLKRPKDGPRDDLGREVGHMKNSVKPYI